MAKAKFIDIGGAPYSTTATLKGWQIQIIGYDLNSERHLLIINQYGEEKRIDLDDENLILREKYQRKSAKL
jgi:hypothetical protein